MGTLADFRLSTRLRRTMAPLVSIICPPDVHSLDLVDAVLDHAELSMRAIPAYLRLGLVAGLTSFELGATAFPSSRGRTFSRLPPDLQEAYFRSWWASPVGALRQFAKGVKGIIAMGYWELPIVRERMAFHPDRWIAEVAKRRLRDYADDIRKADELVTAPDPLIKPASTLLRKVDSNGKAA